MVMEKKWIKDLGVNECIHAPTQEISDKLCKKFDELGLTWASGASYYPDKYWGHYDNRTGYKVKIGGRVDVNNYHHLKVYTINDLLDFEGEEFAVSDESYTKEEIELLDSFAGMAMNGLVSKYGNEGTYSTLSQMSYEVAKEMLRARKETLKNA